MLLRQHFHGHLGQKAGSAQLPEVLRVPTQAVDDSIGHHQPRSLPGSLHVPQHAPLVDVGVVALHAGVAAAPVEPARHVDHVCRTGEGPRESDMAQGTPGPSYMGQSYNMDCKLQTENRLQHAGRQGEPKLPSLTQQTNLSLT